MPSIIILICLCLFASCSKKKPEEVLEAIDVAQTYLSDSKCAEAIKVMESVGRQNDNPIYLQVLASAYSCRAGFSEINFIATDVPLIDTNPSSDLLRSLATLTLSDDTTTDSEEYEDLKNAMNILLEADGATQPSQMARTTAFGARKAGDMGFQLLFLSIVQLGKFLNHYGNTNAAGAKGLGGTSSNTCLLDYTYANAQTVIAALPAGNNCNSNTDGHPDLDMADAEGRRRVCEGLMLITNLIDILNNVDVSGSNSLSSLSEVATVANSFKSAAIAADPDLENLLETTSQTDCEAALASTDEVNNMQLIYAMIYEAGLE